ncbi:MAG: hypothetical protein ABJB02_07575 [Dokdonella sp.]
MRDYPMFLHEHGHAGNPIGALVRLPETEFASADQWFTADRYKREVGATDSAVGRWMRSQPASEKAGEEAPSGGVSPSSRHSDAGVAEGSALLLQIRTRGWP